MDKQFEDILHHREENRLMPFMWIRDGEHDRLVEHIDMIQSMGHKALCVESRPHRDFCGDTWWQDMGLILRECQKRSMQVWLLDDKAFPTGYANGAIEEKYPHLRSTTLVERSVDVAGDVTDAYLQIMYNDPSDVLVGIYAYSRDDCSNRICGKPICLNECVHGDRVYLNLPAGVWRICYFLKTQQYSLKENYINMLEEASCDVLLQEVYESHYQHFSQYFGNTFQGFFSDEPGFCNAYGEWSLVKGNIYDRRIGDAGLALPYSDELLQKMAQQMGEDPTPLLYGLWYDLEGASQRIRHCYMDCATRLYARNFSGKLGAWCRDHGVQYIGHVIEDNGCHARLGHGAGHYFRAIRGQSMGGMDIVLHQVLPGFADHSHNIPCGKFANTEFFHYGLAKLASSISHIYPHMDGNAMCEIFGAYGWGESVPLMKWLCDFLFVRGINCFVPHAFSLKDEDPDSPPHFNIAGYPQKAGYTMLTGYMNRMAHMLRGGSHVCDAAILYHGELEWWNYDCMGCETPAKQLYDHLMDYDFVDMDSLENAHVENGKLRLNRELYPCLIIPAAGSYPPALTQTLNRLAAAGLDVLCIDGCPKGVCGRTVSLCDLVRYMKDHGYAHICASADNPMVRFYHLDRGENQVYMFFNEAVDRCATIQMDAQGCVSVLDLLNQKYRTVYACNDVVTLCLEPYESAVVVSGAMPVFTELQQLPDRAEVLQTPWNISLFDTVEQCVVRKYTDVDTLFNLNGYEHCPSFCGEATYETEFLAEDISGAAYLKVFAEGQTVAVSINGEKPELQICKPFIFDLGQGIRKGSNHLRITLCNTMANRITERHTAYLPVYAGGLTIPPILYTK